eukprot:TRINITY_DN3695_c0_g1_i1.p1 TRINITY_DN3695_c0_g1~~TRINITY_DN3695_c0_g1_i1.p1  ORF type:complete len:689 (+),score=150.69 TRINITY_DN3695_c0_g1_i1:151-2217(+)
MNDYVTAKAKHDRVLLEFYCKTVELILHHRVVFSQNEARTKNNRFNLVAPEIFSVRNLLHLHNPNPLFLEIFHSNDELDKRTPSGEALLECWKIEFVVKRASKAPSLTVLRAVYRKMALLLRSLFSLVLILPSYKLFHTTRHLSLTEAKFHHRISNSSAQLMKFPKGIKTETFDFSDIITPHGVLRVSVIYRESAPIAKEAQSDTATGLISSQHLIQDYVQSPLESELNPFGMPSIHRVALPNPTASPVIPIPSTSQPNHRLQADDGLSRTHEVRGQLSNISPSDDMSFKHLSYQPMCPMLSFSPFKNDEPVGGLVAPSCSADTAHSFVSRSSSSPANYQKPHPINVASNTSNNVKNNNNNNINNSGWSSHSPSPFEISKIGTTKRQSRPVSNNSGDSDELRKADGSRGRSRSTSADLPFPMEPASGQLPPTPPSASRVPHSSISPFHSISPVPEQRQITNIPRTLAFKLPSPSDEKFQIQPYHHHHQRRRSVPTMEVGHLQPPPSLPTPLTSKTNLSTTPQSGRRLRKVRSRSMDKPPISPMSALSFKRPINFNISPPTTQELAGISRSSPKTADTPLSTQSRMIAASVSESQRIPDEKPLRLHAIHEGIIQADRALREKLRGRVDESAFPSLQEVNAFAIIDERKSKSTKTLLSELETFRAKAMEMGLIPMDEVLDENGEDSPFSS